MTTKPRGAKGRSGLSIKKKKKLRLPLVKDKKFICEAQYIFTIDEPLGVEVKNCWQASIIIIDKLNIDGSQNLFVKLYILLVDNILSSIKEFSSCHKIG